jgi:hypothetical protein
MDILEINREELQQLNKKHLFYLIEYEHGCKIGVTTRFFNRMKDYQKPWCYPAKNIYYVKCSRPRQLENMCKRHFNSVGYSHEFFSDSADTIMEYILDDNNYRYYKQDIRFIKLKDS